MFGEIYIEGNFVIIHVKLNLESKVTIMITLLYFKLWACYISVLRVLH